MPNNTKCHHKMCTATKSTNLAVIRNVAVCHLNSFWLCRRKDAMHSLSRC